MGVNDGEVIGSTEIYSNGGTDERFNLVLVAEGYRASELDVFAADCEHFIQGLFAAAPFDEFKCAFNIFRVDVASDESGADDPSACGGTGAIPKTYFDAHYCNSGNRRALEVNSFLVEDVVEDLVPAYHSAQVIVNSPIYGGTGGSVGVASNATTKDDGTPVDWREILIHEMGHSIFHLADEYEYDHGCDTNEPSQNVWSDGEPLAANLTASPTAEGKWEDLVTTSTLPTTSNPDCTTCDTQANPVSASKVGTFEGAGYHHCGLYRPQYDCKMRKLSFPFCAVCERAIREAMAPYDPSFCFRDKLDTSKWVAVVTIIFGVIQGGGGLAVEGKKPAPVDPWGPLRYSLWAALADPKSAAPAVRDVLVATAVKELSELFSTEELRSRIAGVAAQAADEAAEKLSGGTIR